MGIIGNGRFVDFPSGSRRFPRQAQSLCDGKLRDGVGMGRNIFNRHVALQLNMKQALNLGASDCRFPFGKETIDGRGIPFTLLLQ